MDFYKSWKDEKLEVGQPLVWFELVSAMRTFASVQYPERIAMVAIFDMMYKGDL